MLSSYYVPGAVVDADDIDGNPCPQVTLSFTEWIEQEEESDHSIFPMQTIL